VPAQLEIHNALGGYMRWRLRKSFKILAPGSSLQKRVAYSLAIVRLILAPVIFLAVYYLFAMGRIADRIVNVDAPAVRMAEQASLEILEARRAARNYLLLQDPVYLRANQESMTRVRQLLVLMGRLEPDENADVQKALSAINQYQQLFASAASTIGRGSEKTVDYLGEAVMSYEKDLDDLVEEAKHQTRAELIKDLRARVDSFDTGITGTVQATNPALRGVIPDLRSSSQQILQLTSGMEQQSWARVEMDHQEARRLIHRAEWALSIVSAFTLLFSIWASFILPRQVVKPLVGLKEAVDHATMGNYEVEYELHGGGEVVELAKSVQNLTSLLQKQQHDHEASGARQNQQKEKVRR
jgi:nitrogen fixation/metabolism regulation signal transduction histidine kinase